MLQEHADILTEQFEQTAAYRSWGLKAVAIMANHIHLVVGVIGDPEPEWRLRDFKSYGSRALNRHWPTPASGTWWTASGSRRKLADETAIRAAIEYVRSQASPLTIRTYYASGGGHPSESVLLASGRASALRVFPSDAVPCKNSEG